MTDGISSRGQGGRPGGRLGCRIGRQTAAECCHHSVRCGLSKHKIAGQMKQSGRIETKRSQCKVTTVPLFP